MARFPKTFPPPEPGHRPRPGGGSRGWRKLRRAPASMRNTTIDGFLPVLEDPKTRSGSGEKFATTTPMITDTKRGESWSWRAAPLAKAAIPRRKRTISSPRAGAG